MTTFDIEGFCWASAQWTLIHKELGKDASHRQFLDVYPFVFISSSDWVHKSDFNKFCLIHNPCSVLAWFSQGKHNATALWNSECKSLFKKCWHYIVNTGFLFSLSVHAFVCKFHVITITMTSQPKSLLVCCGTMSQPAVLLCTQWGL